MSYFSVGTKDDGLSYYVWADNPPHAKRKVEAQYDLALSSQLALVLPIPEAEIPDGEDVIGEPEQIKEERLARAEEI